MLTLLVAVSLVLSSVFSSSLEDKPYDFRPESRSIVINQGEDYYIGFDQTDNQTSFGHCYIQSDTINIDYPMIKESENDTDEADQSYYSQGISTYNGTLVCAFVYYSVDDKAPLKWTIMAYDNNTETNFTEEVTVEFYYNMPLYLDQLLVLPTASLINFFSPGDTKLKKCSLSFDNITIDLDMDTAKVNNDDTTFKSRLISFGGGKCGYKINNVAKEDNKKLTLYATDDQNKMYRNSSDLVVLNLSTYLKNRTLEVYVGYSATVICGKETDTSTDTDQKFCDLYNPQGELVAHDHMCDFDLDIVTLDDLGIWKCLVGYDYIMDTLQFTTELVEKEPEKIEVFTEDTPDYFIIGCKLVNFDILALTYCVFTRPDGKKFKVTSGVASMNYNSISADLENGKCALEIMKPVRDEDKGSWKCEAIGYLADSNAGAFVDVETSSGTLPFNKHIQKNVRMGNSFSVDCVVPFASDYCYIIAPNGTQYRPEDIFHVTSGFCYLQIDVATPTDNGTWTCSIAQNNGVPDEIVTVEISIIELKVLYANAEALAGEEVTLICNTNSIPIEYCRFVSPTGSSFSLRQENTTSSKISYKGRGLEYGDCGLTISKVEHSDDGQWSCHISSGRYNYLRKTDVTRTIELNVSSSVPTLAESVGIAVGVLVVVIVTGGFIFHRYSRRWRARGNNQGTVQYTEERTSNGSRSSGESIILSVPQNNYNTTYNTT